MFRLQSVKFSDGALLSLSGDEKTPNFVSIITGPNGAGKTKVLTDLAYQYSDRTRRSKSPGGPCVGSVATQSLPTPRRVIAQTFSPFSRFPAELSKPPLLQEFLAPPFQRYVAIGFSRGQLNRMSVSREAVGRIARKIHSEPDQAETLSRTLALLEFESRIRIDYVRSPIAPDVDHTQTEGGKLKAAIDRFLQDLEQKSSLASEERRLARELSEQSVSELSKVLLDALQTCQRYGANANVKSLRAMFSIDLSLVQPSKNENTLLGALLVLSRLGLLRLADCRLWALPQAKWLRLDEGGVASREISIVDASSGQQQILSSLVSVASELVDDSLVLIDEPELSLHPAWQSQFLDLLAAVIEPFQGCHVVIATHSPLIAQRALELDVSVHSLGEVPSSSDEVIQHRGQSIERVLLDIFDQPVRDSVFVGRLLLSLVLLAQEDSKSVPTALLRVKRLKETYQSAPIIDRETISLIEDAISLIGEGSPEDNAGAPS
jgi:hypothetical protein